MSKQGGMPKHTAWDPSLKTSKIYKMSNFIKNWEAIPLLCVGLGSVAGIIFMAYHRLFVTTIDVQLDRNPPRYEIPSVPKFFDLRNPRNLKLMKKTHPWEPAIHLDNRYRLMRHEPMLDAEGNVTDVIGEDETAGDLVINMAE